MISSIIWLILNSRKEMSMKAFGIYCVVALVETVLYLMWLYKWGEE